VTRPLRVESLCDAGQGVAARRAGLSLEAQQLHREVLQAFLTTGRRPHRRDLPTARGLDGDEAFRQLHEADLVHLDAAGYVSAAYPFSAEMTGHLVQLDDGPPLSAMCAIDALGIPLMTGRDGVIASSDPDKAHSIRVERRGERWFWSPRDTVVLLAESGGCGPAAECLCPAITFHTSQERAEDYLRRDRELTGRVLDQARAIEVARWSFGPLLGPEGDT
jgi:hypothetical protein